MSRDNPSMRDLEARLPCQQLDFRPPHGADEHATLLRTTEARITPEAEEPCGAHNGTRLFQDLPAESLLPRLITLGTASRPAHRTPSVLIRTTWPSAVTQKAFAPCGVPSGIAIGACQDASQSPPLERFPSISIRGIPLQVLSAPPAFDPLHPFSRGCSICRSSHYNLFKMGLNYSGGQYFPATKIRLSQSACGRPERNSSFASLSTSYSTRRMVTFVPSVTA